MAITTNHIFFTVTASGMVSVHAFKRHRFFLTWLRHTKVTKDHVKNVISVKNVALKRERNTTPGFLAI